MVFVEIQYFSSFSMIIKVFPLTKSWQNLVSFYVGANALILQVIVKRLFCSFSFQIHMERDVVYGHRRFHAGGWQSITLPWMKERGCPPLCPPPPLDFYKVITPKTFDLEYAGHPWPSTDIGHILIFWTKIPCFTFSLLIVYFYSYCILLFLTLKINYLQSPARKCSMI